MGFQICQLPEADAVLDADPFALLIGMALDQQYPMEHAFRGPWKLKERLGAFDAPSIAAMDPEALVAVASQTPAIHRFPASMAAKVQGIARAVVDDYDGDAARIWTTAADASELLKRIQGLPGFGKQKAQIFVALLAKQADCPTVGWEKAVGDYAQPGYRSVADVVDEASLAKVREYKQMKKKAAATAS